MTTTPTPANPLATAFAEAAMDDLAVPYSLVCDALDLVERAQAAIAMEGGVVDRTAFEEALKLAVAAYEDRGAGPYRFNPRALPVEV